MNNAPGDLVFAHNKNFIGRAIRAVEWVKFRGGDHFNHVAVLYKPTDDGDWLLIQAETRGVTCTKTLSSLTQKGGTYTIFPLSDFNGVNGYPCADDVVSFAHNEVGSKYGFLTIASILFTLFTPKFINVMLPNTWICSALGAEALRAGGWIQHWSDLYQVNPAELWEAVR